MKNKILEQLKLSSTNDVVLEAEIISFEPVEEPVLVDLLWKFVQDKKNSDNADDVTAVCSAIRKMIATININEINRINILFDDALSETIILEITKMLVRKFGGLKRVRLNSLFWQTKYGTN